MASTTFRSCVKKLITDNFPSASTQRHYIRNIDDNDADKILSSLYSDTSSIFNGIENTQECLPLPSEIIRFKKSLTSSVTPRALLTDKYVVIYSLCQKTIKSFGTGPSTIATDLRKDLCALLTTPSFCSGTGTDWSCDGVAKGMIDFKEGTRFAPEALPYNTGCTSAHFPSVAINSDGSVDLAGDIATELCGA